MYIRIKINQMIKRHDLFKDYCRQITGVAESTQIMIFNSISDAELARMFNLSVLRRGYFIR